MLYTIIFTLFLISPVNEQFSGVIKSMMPQQYCETMAEGWASQTLPLNVKRAEFRCIPVIDLENFIQSIPNMQVIPDIS